MELHEYLPDRPMRVTFDHPTHGSLTWTLPDEAAVAIRNCDIETQTIFLNSFSANLEVVCVAILTCFGDRGMTECYNQILGELATLIDQKTG
jgi:hypothetical protein